MKCNQAELTLHSYGPIPTLPLWCHWGKRNNFNYAVTSGTMSLGNRNRKIVQRTSEISDDPKLVPMAYLWLWEQNLDEYITFCQASSFDSIETGSAAGKCPGSSGKSSFEASLARIILHTWLASDSSPGPEEPSKLLISPLLIVSITPIIKEWSEHLLQFYYYC